MTPARWTVPVLLTACLAHLGEAPAAQSAARGSRLSIADVSSVQQIPKFGKFEVSFAVNGTQSTFAHWPYDPAPPSGVPAGVGITVKAVFIDPAGLEFAQPAFRYQHFLDEVRNGRDWRYPTADFVWRVRFSPNQVGTWRYKLIAEDRGGKAETPLTTFTVAPSSHRGFVRVSRADSRYFEFEDGTFFSGLGFQLPEYLDAPATQGAREYQKLEDYGVNFVRLWISSLYGSAWNPYVGGRNHYSGYLPRTGLSPFRDEATGRTSLAMRVDYELAGDEGWYDACRLQWANDAEAVKPNTRYRVRASYSGRKITGPRRPSSPQFGFVVKLGGMFPNCYEPGTSRPVTAYGRNTSGWGQVEGVWNSGNRQFLPKLHMAVENVAEGEVHVQSLSIREMLPDGSDGPEILSRPSMEHELYIPQARAHAFDKIVDLAERSGVYLKLVVMEKGDEIYIKMGDKGEFAVAADNEDGFYGLGRSANKTRWLQQAWWRYLQARWGYSASIHSWELTNEGDPASTRHYELADEFGNFMHYRVFDAVPTASYNHPNDHLVTTSFWHSLPSAFWTSTAYQHVDYADLHAYVSTSFAPAAEKARMQGDAAYYHTWHSRNVADARIGKPVVRGEAGLDVPGRQDEFALGVQRDRAGIWLHNFLWSGLDSGGLYELYWWRSHIWNDRQDHRGVYKLVGLFLADLALNRGGYADWNGTVNNPAVLVVGQKNAKAGSMHLWIQNRAHTWRNVVEGTPIPSASAEIRVSGFAPAASYQVEWWDTYAREKTILASETVRADREGIVLLSVHDLRTDVALVLRSKADLAGAHATVAKLF